MLYLCLALRTASASDLLVRSWTTSQDARQRSVLALLETREGYIWLGTGKGLLRFDGVGFTSFTAQNTPGILGDRISFGTLWEDPKGVLWAGTDFSGVLRNDHGQWQTFQEKQGLSGGKVLRIDGDASGAVWIYTEAGVTRWTNGRLERQKPGEEDEHTGPVVPYSRQRTIDFAKAGLWRHDRNGLERFAYGQWSSFPTPVMLRSFEDDVREIYEDPSHRVWYSLFSYPRTVFCVAGGRVSRYEGLPPNALVTYEDRDGFLWLTDHDAHTSLWKEGHLYPLPELKAPFLLQVLETSNGTLWAGTAGTDLFKFRRRNVGIVPIAGTPEIASVLFQKRDGQVWAGGTSVLHTSPGSNKFIVDPIQAPDRPEQWIQIKALAEDGRGDLLIGSRGIEGVEELTPRGFQHSGLVQGMVQAMLSTQTAETWIGSTSGLYRKTGQTVQRVSALPVRSLLALSSGGLLAGTERGPLVFRDGTQGRGLPPWNYGPIVAMRQDRSGAVWIATQDHGLVCLSGNSFHVLGTADGLPTGVLYSLEFDEAGDLWMGSDLGLMRIRGRSLERKLHDAAGRLQLTVFDAGDGLPASIFDPLGDQGVVRRPNGDLWFGTEQGVAVVRPSTLRTASPDTHPVIEEHEIDQSDPLPGNSIELRPGQTNLQIHYTALGSNHPEQLVFRYRLQNYDRDWFYARGRRVAYYAHLSPGRYTFEVQAADNDGDGWVAGTAAMYVRVLTPFYRSWWFLLLVLLSVGSFLAYQLALRRRRQLADQHNRRLFTRRLLNTQEGERKRIAHELHDSIGQHLVLIRTLAMLPPGSSTSSSGGHLASIAEQAAVAIKEVETISYDLRPYQLDRLGLTKAVLSLIQSFERSSTVRIECSVDKIDDFFPRRPRSTFTASCRRLSGTSCAMPKPLPQASQSPGRAPLCASCFRTMARVFPPRQKTKVPGWDWLECTNGPRPCTGAPPSYRSQVRVRPSPSKPRRPLKKDDTMTTPEEPQDLGPITVLIADDHPLMRQGIRLSLSGADHVAVVGEAANGEEVLECIGFLQPDIVILDLDMPVRDGLSVVRELNRRGMETGIIILTLHTGADLIAEAIELGVRGYIIKSSAVIEVVEAVRRVAGGGSYLSQEALDALQATKFKRELPEELRDLTPMELRMVREIAEGMTSREIAATLDLSGRTVENYRTRICSKLHLTGPNALLQFALRQRETLFRLAK